MPSKLNDFEIKRYVHSWGSIEPDELVTLKNGLADLDKVSMHYNWRYSQWLNLQLSTGDMLSILFYEKNLIGFSLYHQEGEYVHLLKICIDPKHQRLGFGRALLKNDLTSIKQWCEEAKQVYLEVSAANGQAIHLYENYGFKTYHVSKKYYSDGCDALKMTYVL